MHVIDAFMLAAVQSHRAGVWLDEKYVRRHARKDGGTCTNRDVLKAIYDGVSALPRAQMAGFFRKAGYDAPDPEKEDQESAVVVAHHFQ